MNCHTTSKASHSQACSRKTSNSIVTAANVRKILSIFSLIRKPGSGALERATTAYMCIHMNTCTHLYSICIRIRTASTLTRTVQLHHLIVPLEPKSTRNNSIYINQLILYAPAGDKNRASCVGEPMHDAHACPTSSSAVYAPVKCEPVRGGHPGPLLRLVSSVQRRCDVSGGAPPGLHGALQG
jgi:hypothetical protein